jgi:hypothetical protein
MSTRKGLFDFATEFIAQSAGKGVICGFACIGTRRHDYFGLFG